MNDQPHPRTEGIVVKPGAMPKDFKLSKCFVDKKLRIGNVLFEIDRVNDNQQTVTLKFQGIFLAKPKVWWCTVHNRKATGRKRDGSPQCEGGGILMSCACVEFTNQDKPNDSSTSDSAS